MAVVAGTAALSGSGSASLNGDELATVSAASRSFAGLWTLAQSIDGHFLPYYLFMQLWAKAGTAELWLRLPSALAIGVAAWFLCDLGRRVHGLTAGIAASLIFAVLPSVSYYGAFARPYALAAAASVFALWVLLRASGSPRSARAWVLYALTVALVCCTHLFAVLTLPAHLFLLRRATAARLLPALAVGFLPAVVLGLLGYGERHAISWIPQRGPDVLLKLPKMVAGANEVGLLLFAAALAGILALALTGHRGRGDTRRLLGTGIAAAPAAPGLPADEGVAAVQGAVAGQGVTARQAAGAFGAWLLLPPVLLLAISHLVTPVYVDRYLFVTAPALALLAGIAVAAVPRVGAVAAAVLIAGSLVLALPQHQDVRDHNGRFEDFPGAIRQIKAEPGDALIFGQSSVRAGFDYYAAGTLWQDVLRLGQEPEPGGFGFPESRDVAVALQGRERVWMIWRGAKTSNLPRVRAVKEAGFRQVSSWHSAELPGLTVALFTNRRTG
ncbi:protein O-mannosyl-transferase family [Nonomuraea sp. NBC_01738]|uniref:protein O-mannosyl-transferase family n=1 Tax=Nonomuraea sp. NBC_01738 TaxID=2976003 RepID=UPI002E149452